MITLYGISRFRIRSEERGFSPYVKADVEWADFHRDRGKAESDGAFDRDGFFELLKRYFESQQLSTDWDTLQEAEPELLVNSLAMLCPFESEEKQALLEAPTLAERRETLVTLMEFDLRDPGGEEVLQ